MSFKTSQNLTYNDFFYNTECRTQYSSSLLYLVLFYRRNRKSLPYELLAT